MPLPNERIAHAHRLLAEGQAPQAEHLCRQALEQAPHDADAWFLLGLALYSQSKPAESVPAYQRALSVRPEWAEAHFRLAQALEGQGRRDLALAHYQHTLRLAPEHGEAHNGLGVALAEQGKTAEASEHFRQAIRARPELAASHHNLGVALAQQGQPHEAVASLERALQVRPDYPEALYNLGAVLAELGRRDEAIARYRRAIELRPGYGEAYNNLGLALNESGKHAEAMIVLQQAVRLRPQATESHNNLGLAFAALGRFDEAVRAYHEALRLRPGYAEAHGNLASAYKDHGRLEEALACYQVALWHAPRMPSIRYNRALALLQHGDYAEGWREYEWRWQRKQTPARPFHQPRWDGSSLAGKTILLWSEQGLGDTMQFVRYAALVKQQGVRVVLECPRCLVPLLRSCTGVDQLVAEGEPLPAFDVQAPLMSLPGIVGTTLETVPASVPYLGAEPERVTRWGQRLAGLVGASELKVGIVWQGNPRFEWDRWRSVPLACFAPLAQVEGARLVSLQKGPGAEQLRQWQGPAPIGELGDDLDAEAAFVDTAAVLRGLDLVVSVDTSVAHLAGALGVPTWVVLSAAMVDWRWLVGREDTPWYPSVRLVRQERLGEWRSVFEGMAEALRRLAAGRAKRGTGSG